MDAKITKITTGFHAADLSTEPIDEANSAKNYARLLEKALVQRFPKTPIHIDWDENTSGVLPFDLQTRIYYADGMVEGPDSDMAQTIDEIASQVYQGFDWVVEL
jgi:hypothetical protein